MGTASFTWSWPRALAVWAMVFLFMLATTLFSDNGLVQTLRLARSGQPATAVITQHNPGHHNGCTYSYLWKGIRLQHSQDRCGSLGELGQVIRIRVLPSNPKVATAYPPANSLSGSLMFLIGAPVLLAGLAGIRRRPAFRSEEPS